MASNVSTNENRISIVKDLRQLSLTFSISSLAITFDAFLDTRRHPRRDSIVVSTLRCGRNNPGSNPGHGTFLLLMSLTPMLFATHID